MPDDARGQHRAGQTVLLVGLDEVEPLVGQWRWRFDPSASAGIPAHVTVLFPFLDTDRLSDVVIGDLRALFSKHAPFTVRFDSCQRFPDVLYLAPMPDQPFRRLTDAVTERWPEAPPYGGQFADVIPHLTVAHGQQPQVFDQIETALTARLPVVASASSVSLFTSDGEQWHQIAQFPLSG